MLALVLAALMADPPAVVGVWEGPVVVKGVIPLRFVVTLKADAAGKLSGTLQSPDTDDHSAPLTDITFGDGKFSAKVKSGSLAATLSADGLTLTGMWRAGGGGSPVTLKKVDKATVRKRPQTPHPPYPYRADDVTFPNRDEGLTLAGTLTRPPGDGPFPAVLLVSGSGPQDRDESLMGHKPFRVLADHLTRNGVAVLRCDDRGVGKSGGRFDTATSEDFATDAYAAVRFLRTQPGIDCHRVGIAGHSEGGMIAPMVAADYPDEVAFIVLLAGPGLGGAEIAARQAADMLKADGRPAADADKLANFQRASLKALLAGVKDRRPGLGAAAGGPAAGRWRPDPPNGLDRWMHFFLAHDPAPTLARVRCAVLAVNGEKDTQVAAGPNLAAIKAACPRADSRELPGLNHLFQPCRTGALSEYADIETTLDPTLLTAVTDWVKRQ